MNQLRYLIRYAARHAPNDPGPLEDSQVSETLEYFRSALQDQLERIDAQVAVRANMPFGYREWRSIFITVNSALDAPDVDRTVADLAERHSLKCIVLPVS